jgi:N-acetylneuraminic acid mutarotase
MAPLNGKLILFGGGSPGTENALSDTWSFDGNAWTQVNTTGPSGRWGAAMTPLGDKLVLFGGGASTAVVGTNVFNADTWTFDGATWTQLSASGPPGRAWGGAATLGGRFVLFGGRVSGQGYASLNDTWTFDGNSWSQLSIAGGPSQRDNCAMVTFGDEIILFGGFGGSTGLSDTWKFDGASWTQLLVVSPAPGLPYMAVLGP